MLGQSSLVCVFILFIYFLSGVKSKLENFILGNITSFDVSFTSQFFIFYDLRTLLNISFAFWVLRKHSFDYKEQFTRKMT